MNVGDKVLYNLAALDRGYLNRRLPEGATPYVIGDTAEAMVTADLGGDVLDLYIPLLRAMPFKHQSIPRGTEVGHWKAAI